MCRRHRRRSGIGTVTCVFQGTALPESAGLVVAGDRPSCLSLHETAMLFMLKLIADRVSPTESAPVVQDRCCSSLQGPRRGTQSRGSSPPQSRWARLRTSLLGTPARPRQARPAPSDVPACLRFGNSEQPDARPRTSRHHMESRAAAVCAVVAVPRSQPSPSVHAQTVLSPLHGLHASRRLRPSVSLTHARFAGRGIVAGPSTTGSHLPPATYHSTVLLMICALLTSHSIMHHRPPLLPQSNLL